MGVRGLDYPFAIAERCALGLRRHPSSLYTFKAGDPGFAWLGIGLGP
jgi:hypothetical protein